MFRLENVPPVVGAFAFVTLLVILPLVGLFFCIALAGIFRVM
jgi:hypothetical protein